MVVMAVQARATSNDERAGRLRGCGPDAADTRFSAAVLGCALFGLDGSGEHIFPQ